MKTLSLPSLQHTLCRHGDAETAGQHVTRDHLATLLLSHWLSAACFSDFWRRLCVEPTENKPQDLGAAGRPLLQPGWVGGGGGVTEGDVVM